MKKFIISFFIIFFNFAVLKAEFVNQIVINGNDRVSDETIILLGDIKKDIEYNDKVLNNIINFSVI